jgi:hypothetical protein
MNFSYNISGLSAAVLKIHVCRDRDLHFWQDMYIFSTMSAQKQQTLNDTNKVLAVLNSKEEHVLWYGVKSGGGPHTWMVVVKCTV